MFAGGQDALPTDLPRWVRLPEPDGYSLIVDGAAQLEGDNLRVTPSRAILHRPEIIAPPNGEGCGADCIEL